MKEPPSVWKIILQRGTYDTWKDCVRKNEYKVAIPSEYFIKKLSSNEKISHIVVLLIMHDGEYLDCGNDVSDVFDTSTGIWWHHDDANIK